MRGSIDYKRMLCILVEIIVDQAFFLDRCDDETLDPDIAVKQLEDMGHLLDQLSAAERAALIECLEAMAAKANEPGKEDYRQFVNSFPFFSGLVDATNGEHSH